MASVERTAYPRFRPSLTRPEVEALYGPTDAELAFARSNARSDRGRLALLVLLKCHQRLGRLPSAKRVPARIRRYLAAELGLPVGTPLGARNRQDRHRYVLDVRAFLGVRSYSEGGAGIAAEAMREAAATRSDPADLVNIAVEALVRDRVELPAFSALDRLAGSARERVHHAIYASVAGRLSAEDRGRLDALLDVEPGGHLTGFTRLKAPPGPPTLKRVRERVRHLAELVGLLKTAPLIAGVAHTKVRQFAAEARALEVGDVKGLADEAHRRALLVCFVHDAQVSARDDLAEMFLRRMRRTHNQAKKALARFHERHREVEEEMLAAFADVLGEADGLPEGESPEIPDEVLGRRVRRVLAAYGGVGELREKYRAVALYHSGNYLPLLWDAHRAHRSALFDLLDLLEPQPATQDRALLRALDYVREHRTARRDHLPDEVDLGFLSLRWQAFIETRERGGDRHGDIVLSRRELEVAVLSHVADALRSGDLFVPGSEAFADYREQLLSWDECEERLPAYCEAVGLPATAADFVSGLRDQLTTAAERADSAFPDNAELSIDKAGRPHLRRMEAKPVPEGTDALKEALHARVPERHLLDVLKNVSAWSGLTRHFGPPSGSDPKLSDPERRYLLAVFGYGTGLGPTQLSRHARASGGADSATPRALELANRQHVTTASLEAALRDIIAEYARFELPSHWGSGRVAIADGTHVPLVENGLLGERSVRYGVYGGIAYHHVSDTYIALFSHFVACGVWEAVYILDGLLKNESVLQPDTVHADTHGQSEPVFGLAHLLGIRLMPRMRTWDDVAFYRPDAEASYNHLDSLFTRMVDWGLIERHWADLMQVALSVQAGAVLPSMLLRRLGTQARKNALYRAFRELGRVTRTLFLLDYVTDLPLRKSIRAATTKVEAYNGFTEWVRFGGEAIPTGDPVEREKRVKYTDLVASAIMLQNVADMSDALAGLVGEGWTVTPGQVARLSPYGTSRVKRFGEYVLDMDGAPPPLTPRPLGLSEEPSPLR